MVDSSGSFQLVSIADAARILSVSESTVRRLVKSGRLEAEQAQRPQGHVWLVKVPSRGQQPPDQPPRQIGAAGADPPAPPALAVWMSSVLEPLTAELTASRHQLVSQAETIGTLRADLATAAGRIATLEARTAPETAEVSPEPSPAWWRGSWPWIAATGALCSAVVVLLFR